MFRMHAFANGCCELAYCAFSISYIQGYGDKVAFEGSWLAAGQQ